MRLMFLLSLLLGRQWFKQPRRVVVFVFVVVAAAAAVVVVVIAHVVIVIVLVIADVRCYLLGCYSIVASVIAVVK